MTQMDTSHDEVKADIEEGVDGGPKERMGLLMRQSSALFDYR